jgi:hypothetical protein
VEEKGEKDMNDKVSVSDKALMDIEEKFDVLVTMLHEVRNTRGDVDGRSVSVAITNVQQGHLWFTDATKGVVKPTE